MYFFRQMRDITQGGGAWPSVRWGGGGENPPKRSAIIFERSINFQDLPIIPKHNKNKQTNQINIHAHTY